jgi:hypothetical protein
MKIFSLVVVLAAMIFSRATAQVTVEVTMAQEQFLPGEALPVAVKITNRSGQLLHLGTEANWLTFSVESADGFVVIKNSEVPVLGEFELESSQFCDQQTRPLQDYRHLARQGVVRRDGQRAENF